MSGETRDMSHPGPLRIVVVGSGVAAALATAALSRALGPRVATVRLVETSDAEGDLGLLGGGVTALPQLRQLHALLGLDERELAARSGAAFRLGSSFEGWSGPAGRFVRTLGGCGATIDSIAFHHHWGRLKRLEDGGALTDYALGAVAGELGRFAFPSPDPASVLSTLQYALNLDGPAYVELLRAYARAKGASCTRGELAEVALRGEDGFIAAITLADGERVEGDLFVDCTGARSRLLGEALGVAFEDWTAWLPCDGFVVSASARQEAPASLTRIVARKGGWRLTVPLRESTGEVYAFSSAHVGESQAMDELAQELGRGMTAPPRATRAPSGRRARAWEKNCVAIGAAAGFFEPLDGVGLHFVHSGVAKLIGLLPDHSCAGVERDEYNRRIGAEMDRVRDFLAQHYASAGRDDSDFWRERRAARPPDSLLQKTELFAARGELSMYEDDLFAAPDWAALLIGQGAAPKRIDPLIDRIPVATTRERLHRMRTIIARAAQAMPPHRAVLDALTRARPGPPASRVGEAAS